jgi:hypothetical protein
MEPQMKLDIINLWVNSGKFDVLDKRAQTELLNSFNSVYYPEERRQYNEDYYYFNKDDIKKDKNSILECRRCGADVNKSNIARHKKTEVCKLKGELIDHKLEIARLKKEAVEREMKEKELENEITRLNNRVECLVKNKKIDLRTFRNTINKLNLKLESLGE